MARARVVRPELRTSEKVCSWPIEVRYFFVLLWGYVDDHGKGKDNARLIKADCFPLDDDVSAAQVESWLEMLAEAGVIVRYTVDGCDFLAFPHWQEHQKVSHPTKDVYPDFTAANATIRGAREALRKSSGDSPEVLALKLKEVKLIDTVTAPTAGDGYSDDFEQWWDIYPIKKAKGSAWKAFQKALERVSLTELMEKTRAYAESDLPDPQFIPHGATWLNADRWNDEIKPKWVDPDAWMQPKKLTKEEYYALRATW